MRVLHAATCAGLAILASGCLFVQEVLDDGTMGDGQGEPPFVRTSSEPCIEVVTEPPGAMVSIRKYIAPPPCVQNIDQFEPWRTFFTKGTTPYVGMLKDGKWEVKVELPGYEPVRWVLDIDRREAQKYSLKLTPLNARTE